jgi:hypothetical protein
MGPEHPKTAGVLYVSGIERTPAWGDGVHPWPRKLGIHDGFHVRPVVLQETQAVDGGLTGRAGQHEAAHPMVDPHRPFDGTVADALVAGDHDQSLGTDVRQPLVVEAASRNLREIGMTREDDVPVQISECLAEGQVVLVDEEPGRQDGLCRERPQLLLVGDRCPYFLGGHLIATGDLLDRLAGVEQLPQPLGGHPLHRGTPEADKRVDDNR